MQAATLSMFRMTLFICVFIRCRPGGPTLGSATFSNHFTVGNGATYVTSMSVCLFVCLSVQVIRKPLGRTSPKNLCVMPVAVSRSSSGGDAIPYALPVLWMTSFFT